MAWWSRASKIIEARGAELLCKQGLFRRSRSFLVPAFADIHITCIETDHTIVTFTPPLKRDVIIDYWKERVADVIEGKCIIVMILAKDKGREQLAGYVALYRPLTETGPFRGSVEKLLVSPNFRRCGLAKKLMARLEVEAKIHGQTTPDVGHRNWQSCGDCLSKAGS
ncbi:hypothetical protein C8F04DRAFT_1408932 [Mycena alexandri]|uniref:N-acetyltransferase domain-containing protein n=1 Tax=Mycena alexandri TaxID=1745969 RepID=A0AAD6RV91_9AGAR|nr:hypothetical protein C8F04DRAFT_1408932 [Mycena alexandri]